MVEWLVADVGGTNTRVGLADQHGVRNGTSRKFHNEDFAGLAPLLAAYMENENAADISAICAGVAGPVRKDVAQLTNYNWLVEAKALQRATGAGNVILLNDLQAQGYALDDLSPGHFQPLFEGHADDGPRLVLGLGTGCNVAVVHRIGSSLLVPPAESGHTSLPFAVGDLGALCAHLQQIMPHAPIEAALSGPGLARIYGWLTGRDISPVDMLVAPDRDKTMRLYSALLGLVAGNLCLAHMATGGLYLIGGMACAVAPFLAETEFRENFISRGPYTHILRDIPIALITDDAAALRGCARYLAQTHRAS